MRHASLLLVALLVSPTVVRAQAMPSSPSAVAAARGNFAEMSEYVLRAAMEMPESGYAFKPAPDVRSFGELIGHVAGAQAMFCAMALGEKPPAEDAVQATTKTGLVEAMRQSNAGCARAYAQSDAEAAGMIDVFGRQRTRLYALIMNAGHTAEHYGNLVTYLRMNHLVPPSSQPAGGATPAATPAPAAMEAASSCPRNDGEHPYFEFQVERQVTQKPGTGGPRYPAALKEQRVNGQALVQFVVDTLGRYEPCSFHVLKTSNQLFADAVRDALPEMRFTAAEIGGRKVRQLVQQPFTFTIAQ